MLFVKLAFVANTLALSTQNFIIHYIYIYSISDKILTYTKYTLAIQFDFWFAQRSDQALISHTTQLFSIIALKSVCVLPFCGEYHQTTFFLGTSYKSQDF